MGTFTMVWLGQMASMFGSSMTMFGLMIWAWDKTGEATALALIGFFGFAPETELQVELLNVLRRRFERVSAERLVAGSGLQNIYSALLEMQGKKGELTAREIFAAASEPGPAADAVSLFFQVLGQVAGDLALTLGANDGVYIAGGIAKRYPDILADGTFRAAFESKGRHRHIMERIPTILTTHEQPGLLAAAYVAQELAAGLG